MNDNLHGRKDIIQIWWKQILALLEYCGISRKVLYVWLLSVHLSVRQTCAASSATWSGTRMSVASRCPGATAWTCAAAPWARPGALTVRSVPRWAPRSTRPSAPEDQASPTEETSWLADPFTKVGTHCPVFLVWVSFTHLGSIPTRPRSYKEQAKWSNVQVPAIHSITYLNS